MTRLSIAVAATVLLFGLAGCAGGESTEVKPIKTESSDTPTTSEAVEDEVGTRTNPIEIGQHAKYSDDSMWMIGASAATVVHQGYIEMPLYLGVDWNACREYNGGDCDEGADPWVSLNVEYVAADGSSYDVLDDPTIDWLSIPAQLYDVGTIYEPLEEVKTSVLITVPADKIPGGVWHVMSAVSAGNSIWVASGL